MASIAEMQDMLRQLRGSVGSEQELYQRVAQYAANNNLSPDVVNQVIQGVAPNPEMWNTSRVQGLMTQYAPSPYGGGDQYGLSGATNAVVGGLRSGEQSVNQGLNASLAAIHAGQAQAQSSLAGTRQQVGDIFSQGLSYLSPYTQTGTQANTLQSALTGAAGRGAQQQAFADYQESPGVDYARQQGEKAILRNASALGGLGGGNVMNELNQHAVGTYMQDFNNQFNRLGTVADRGYSASATSAGMRGQEAGLQAGLGQFAAQIPMQAAGQMADLQTGAANNIGGMRYGTGNTLGGLRYQAGQDVASSVQGTASALAALAEREGAGMTDIYGNVTNNINKLYQDAFNGDANAKEQLAAMLANISVSAGSQVTGLPTTVPGQTNYLGQLGQIAGGVGGIASGLSYGSQPATAPAYSGNYYNGGTTSPYSPYSAVDAPNAPSFRGYA